MIHKTNRQFEKVIPDNAKTSPKRFWGHIRRRLKTKSEIAPLQENICTKTSLKLNSKLNSIPSQRTLTNNNVLTLRSAKIKL